MSGSPRGSATRSLVDPGFWRGRRVLVTGHTGFKGAWLSLWLTEMGAHVTGVSDRIPTQPSLFAEARVAERIDDRRADVRDFQSLRRILGEARPQVVFHMAAQSLVRRSFEDPRTTYETNVMGTVNLFEAVRGVDGVGVVVNVTSDKCYENREWEWGYRENEPMGGHDPYSSSKGAAELVTAAYRRSFFSEPGGTRLASARAGNVIGGGDWAIDRLVPDIMRAATSGATIRVRNPNSIRPWQHVLNPLSGYLLLAQAIRDDDQLAAGWNFGPGDEDVRPVQWILDRVVALWPEHLACENDAGPHPHEARYLKLDSSRARTHLGWVPPIDLGHALDSIVTWHRAMQSGADMRAVTLEQIASLIPVVEA